MTPAELTEATVGLEVLYVIGGLVSVSPAESLTVLVMAWVVLPLRNGSALPPVEVARVIEATGQVVKVRGALVAPAAEAKNEVWPGVLAVVRAWLKRRPFPVVVSVTTAAFCALQAMGPMVEVMSVPLLVATT